MIAKRIHYCWFGNGSMPRLARKCLESWERVCPDYEIVRWDDGNFDVSQHPYLELCAAQKRWAFMSDLARLLVVYQHGGIYLDTDVELVRRPDHLLHEHAFFGFETPQYVATGLGFGAETGNNVLEVMIKEYDRFRHIGVEDFKPIGCPRLNTHALVGMGFKRDGRMQMVSGARILPSTYLNPYDTVTGRLNIRPETIAIHWYGMSALSPMARWRMRFTRPIHRILGV